MKYKVRFHLGKGEHYRHFQITEPNGRREFYDPEMHIIRMTNARLHNNCKVAEQIYKGRNKTVCSWIECDEVKVESPLAALFGDHPDNTEATELKYNPRKSPHWLENGENVDSKRYSRLFTSSHRVFVEVE